MHLHTRAHLQHSVDGPEARADDVPTASSRTGLMLLPIVYSWTTQSAGAATDIVRRALSVIAPAAILTLGRLDMAAKHSRHSRRRFCFEVLLRDP